MVPIRPAHHTCVRPYFCRSCAQLDLSANELGPEGAAALAPAIADSASMTRLDVMGNLLGNEGKALLRKAIEGRSGFELLL